MCLRDSLYCVSPPLPRSSPRSHSLRSPPPPHAGNSLSLHPLQVSPPSQSGCVHFIHHGFHTHALPYCLVSHSVSSRLFNHCPQHIHLRCLNSTLLSPCHAPCLRPIQQYRRQHSLVYCSLHLFVHIFIFQDGVYRILLLQSYHTPQSY